MTNMIRCRLFYLISAQMNVSALTDQQKIQLIQNRWESSASVFDEVNKVFEKNTKVYDNKPDWMDSVPRKKAKTRSNRIFTDTEAVINSLIANPPKPNVIPTRDTDDSKTLASSLESYFNIKYQELHVKEVIRKGLRNLYFARFVVLKPFWNSKINDFDVRVVDPRKIRVHKSAPKELDSEFAIEEITDNLQAVLNRFPKKRAEILQKAGFTEALAAQIVITNPEVTYYEAWIKDRLMCKWDNILLDDVPNPYWDWKGLLITPEEDQQLQQAPYGDQRRMLMQQIRGQQGARQAAAPLGGEQAQAAPQPDAQSSYPVAPAVQGQQAGAPPSPIPDQQGGITVDNTEEQIPFKSYFFNHFDAPRKPYIIATIFNSDNSPVGRTSMIEQATPLQESIDRRKMQIDENAEMMNGWLKVDSKTMSKADAEKIRFETKGVIWGSGVKDGVVREVGQPLPAFIVEDLKDSRAEIDNIMAATSAFKGQREGAETKAGRLALVDQSFLMLNEMVETVDYLNYELFNWFYQLAKCRYTEYHFAKLMGKDEAVKTLEIIQDDFEQGTEVRIIAGKTLPEDKEFKYERAQNDVKEGLIAPVDYFEAAGYDDPKRIAKNAVMYHINPIATVGLTPQEMKAIAPPPQPTKQEAPKVAEAIAFKDLPPEGKVQMAAQAGIHLHPTQIQANDDNQKATDTAHSIVQSAAQAALKPTPKPNQPKPQQ